MLRELCLDTETTGLDPRTGDKIIEIACVELIDKVRTGDFFHVYVNPRREVPEAAFRIHGISTEFLKDKPIFDHVADKFLDYIKDAKLVIHNAPFDMKFLNHELSAIGMDILGNENVIDSLVIARRKFPGSPNSLDALCKRFGVDLSKRSKHGALLDTELLADVYIELMGGAQSGLSFASFNDENKSDNDQSSSVEFTPVRRRVEKREFKLSGEDLKKHQEFIEKNIKNVSWEF